MSSVSIILATPDAIKKAFFIASGVARIIETLDMRAA